MASSPTLRSFLCPATSCNDAKPGNPDAEQRDRCRFGHRGGNLGDDDLTVAGEEIGDQDLVRADVERAAATTGSATQSATATASTAT
jgi:hypothetical protein